MVIGETNDANGFSVVFSEPVKAQVLGWQGVLIPNESRPDPTLIYNSFNFAALEIQPGLEVVNITFGTRKSNDEESVYKAIYNAVSETWSLNKITLN
ncbi:hypothetical protein MHB40_13200 [Lysinibacillus sp. FSL K6-0057]|uniref:hypothetical protein n=1 Tax=Lysinibacillus sp. FSL K6-0057 TaxID=2921411 RepID=UPI003159D10B